MKLTISPTRLNNCRV